jgi:tRNA (cmo5U34)-methyltransferase
MTGAAAASATSETQAAEAHADVTTRTVNRWVEPEWAQEYLEKRDSIPHRAEGHAALLELLDGDVKRVLDLGTGDGFTLARVLAAHPGAVGIGVDFSVEMLERARARFGNDSRVEIREHDLDDALPPALGSFDLIVSSFAIHHCVPERQRALCGEVFEHLVAGGRFMNLEHVASPTPALHAEFLAALGAEEDPSNKLVAVDTELGWLRDIGFVDVDCFWKWRELALLSGRRPD